MSRYTLRFGTTRIPTVEVLHAPPLGIALTERDIVKRCYGLTTQHAYKRALSWARRNGDPR